MRIVFMGTPDFAVPSLSALCDAGYEVVGVFTQPDRPKGRGNKLTPSPVKCEAERRKIPVFQPLRIRKDGLEDLKALQPDLCVTAAFGQILSQEILDIPPLGTINVHASILPKHRGSAPIAWGMLNGDAEAGISTMMTDKGIDTGDILLQQATPIADNETCGELTTRLADIGAELLLETLKKLQDGTLKRIPQNEADMTYDPKLEKEMGEINWEKSAFMTVRQIHGLNPWPGASVPYGDGKLKLLRAETVEGSGEQGTVLEANPKRGLVVACAEGAVLIRQLQAPGGKPMDSRDYLRGHPIPVGTKLI